MTSRVKLNIIANYSGKAWMTLMSLAFIPLYIKFLGIEAYALIGFFATLTSIFGVLDLGLSATLNREFGRASVTWGLIVPTPRQIRGNPGQSPISGPRLPPARTTQIGNR